MFHQGVPQDVVLSYLTDSHSKPSLAYLSDGQEVN